MTQFKAHKLIRPFVWLSLSILLLPVIGSAATTRVIEVIAAHNSQYHIPGQSKAVVTVFAGEQLHLRITAQKGDTENRDGSVHGFTLLRASDRSKVPGWDFLLKPGVNEIDVRAPEEPGEYQVVCTVICTHDHEGMHMKFVVLPVGDHSPVLLKTTSSDSPGLGREDSFIGEVADTQCALNVHSLTRSHQEMLKAKGMGTDATSCARYCVRNMGGSYVLIIGKNTIYRLDDTLKGEAFAGRKVRLTGDLDRSTDTIHVISIQNLQ
jgi:hypothetical protein